MAKFVVKGKETPETKAPEQSTPNLVIQMYSFFSVFTLICTTQNHKEDLASSCIFVF